MNTSRGEPTSAIYGLSVLLLKLLREHPGAAIVFALDAPGGSFRNTLASTYKAHRPALPSPLTSQIPRLHQLVESLGAPACIAPGFEADDILATLATRQRDAQRLSRIVTGDRDLFQVARPPIDVLFVGRRAQDPILYDETRVRERFGVEVTQLPTLWALVGDPSDNIEGLAGVGPKTAAAWVREHGDVANILAAVDRLRPARLRATVLAARQRLALGERLATLRTDVPIDPALQPITPGPDALARTATLFETLEFTSLLPRLHALPR